jgi:hypothetical protein
LTSDDFPAFGRPTTATLTSAGSSAAGAAGGRLTEISERLEHAARKLRAGELASEEEREEAARLAGECAELASQAAAELDRLIHAAPHEHESAPGQEELL